MATLRGVADSRPVVAGDKSLSAEVPQYLSQPDTGSLRWDRPAAHQPPAECRPPNKSSGRDRYRCGCKWGSASFVKAQIIGKAQTITSISLVRSTWIRLLLACRSDRRTWSRLDNCCYIRDRTLQPVSVSSSQAQPPQSEFRNVRKTSCPVHTLAGNAGTSRCSLPLQVRAVHPRRAEKSCYHNGRRT